MPGLISYLRSTHWRSCAFLGALGLAVFLIAYEIAFLPGDEDRHHFIELWRGGEYWSFAFSAVLAGIGILLTIGFFIIALGGGSRLKILCLLLFSAAAVAEYAHHEAFRRFSHYSTAAVGMHAGDWLFSKNAVVLYFNPLCVPPILLFVVLLLSCRRSFVQNKWALAVVLLMTAFAAGTAFFSDNRYPTVSLWSSIRTTIGYPVIETAGKAGSDAFGARPSQRVKVDYVARSRPTNNIVFIVDESIRADHLHINGYAATPVPAVTQLSRARKLVNFGIASAATTCSETANNLLLTGLNELPDRTQKIYVMPTIFQYARAMGYRTFEFDGQVSSVWKGTVADLDHIEHRRTPVDLAAAVRHPYDIDAEIARRVRSIVARSTGNFIWVGKRGVHEPYSDAFPSGEANRRPNKTSDPSTRTDRLVADYDAAIRYNHNIFFEQLLNARKPAPKTIYLYTADHGQSLREGGSTVSHCSTSRPEAMVPLFIFGSEIDPGDFDTGYRASHANIFPTLLDFMKVPPQARKFRYANSLTKAKRGQSARRYYYDHDITGEEGGKSYPFDR